MAISGISDTGIFVTDTKPTIMMAMKVMVTAMGLFSKNLTMLFLFHFVQCLTFRCAHCLMFAVLTFDTPLRFVFNVSLRYTVLCSLRSRLTLRYASCLLLTAFAFEVFLRKTVERFAVPIHIGIKLFKQRSVKRALALKREAKRSSNFSNRRQPSNFSNTKRSGAQTA